MTTRTRAATYTPPLRRPDEVGDELRAVRAREAAHGLDAWPRVSMIRLVRTSSPSR